MHTGEPWVIIPKEHIGFTIAGPTFSTQFGRERIGEIMREDDANLCVASPTLLSACRLALNKINALPMRPGQDTEAWIEYRAIAPILRAAIEKAVPTYPSHDPDCAGNPCSHKNYCDKAAK